MRPEPRWGGEGSWVPGVLLSPGTEQVCRSLRASAGWDNLFLEECSSHLDSFQSPLRPVAPAPPALMLPAAWILSLCVCLLSRFSVVCLLATPWTVAHRASLSMGFPRQEYWSGLPFPSPGDLPNAGIEPTPPASPALQADSLPLSPRGSPIPPFTSIHSALLRDLHLPWEPLLSLGHLHFWSRWPLLQLCP